MISIIVFLVFMIIYFCRKPKKQKKTVDQNSENQQTKPRKKRSAWQTLVIMQLKNKLDLSWLSSKKTIIRTIVFAILKFVIVTGITFVVLFLMEKVAVFYSSEANKIMILIISFCLLLSLIACTIGLMNNLYFSDDNKVLITLPVSANKIFLSKIIVYYVYELKRSFSFLIPITLGCIILLLYRGACSPVIILWMWIPLVLIVAIPVLIGSLLSIPLMYIKTFLKKHPIVEIITYSVMMVGVITLIIFLISLIPENINLVSQWPFIRNAIRDFLIALEQKMWVMSQMIYMIIGSKQPNMKFALTWSTFLRLDVMVIAMAIIAIIAYFVARPLFFKMMSKSFEVDGGHIKHNKNVRHNKYITFINKELKINLRSFDISINYLIIYIAIPIAILLLNSIFAAMETKTLGDIMTYTANILLICLPLLASNSLIATLYSREGRAGYMKKTKPVLARYPLLSKLFFNVVFSIPSIFITVAIFGSFSKIGVLNIIILGFAILLLHVGHMLWCAMLDIMNPQNEQYATTGVVVSNPNEDRATIIAFILSAFVALMSYKFFSEATLSNGGVTIACVKILLFGVAIFVALTILFTLRVKAFYYEK